VEITICYQAETIAKMGAFKALSNRAGTPDAYGNEADMTAKYKSCLTKLQGRSN
jgi:hypothetical protein